MYIYTNIARKNIDKALTGERVLANVFPPMRLIVFIYLFFVFLLGEGTDNKTELAKGESVCEI